MPPFREKPIRVSRLLDGDALKELRDIGHEHRVNIVDPSYDVPRGAKVIKFPGSSADAFLGIVRLIPVEDNRVEFMGQDPELENAPQSSVVKQAEHNFDDAVATLLDNDGIEISSGYIYRRTEHMPGSDLGFYDTANTYGDNTLFVVTTDELPFACASFIAGHSQRTD